eukprot:78762-Chlamydomonas_euryale.AAC.1
MKTGRQAIKHANKPIQADGRAVWQRLTSTLWLSVRMKTAANASSMHQRWCTADHTPLPETYESATSTPPTLVWPAPWPTWPWPPAKYGRVSRPGASLRVPVWSGAHAGPHKSECCFSGVCVCVFVCAEGWQA